MSPQPFSALVVDDDPIARKAVGFALEREGFWCAFAADGDSALEQVASHAFDLVVTDLRMPNMHGHALAVELLAGTPAPIIIVHSSVDDPRLTKDLMMRGVDDIIYKPTNYAAFAAKACSLVMRRRKSASPADVRSGTPQEGAGVNSNASTPAGGDDHPQPVSNRSTHAQRLADVIDRIEAKQPWAN